MNIDIDDFIIFGGPTFLGIIICFSFLFLGYEYEKFQCSSRSELMKKEYNYGFINGCMIKVKGEYIPIENYKVIN